MDLVDFPNFASFYLIEDFYFKLDNNFYCVGLDLYEIENHNDLIETFELECRQEIEYNEIIRDNFKNPNIYFQCDYYRIYYSSNKFYRFEKNKFEEITDSEAMLYILWSRRRDVVQI